METCDKLPTEIHGEFLWNMHIGMYRSRWLKRQFAAISRTVSFIGFIFWLENALVWALLTSMTVILNQPFGLSKEPDCAE